MELKIVKALTNNFESFARKTEDGLEFWLARDLQHLLGYSKWENFQNVIFKAKTACELSGQNIADHFPDVRKMVELGSSSETEKELSQVIFEQTKGNQNFALIRSKGDKALFNKTTQQMKDEWKIKNKPLADFMPTILLKAKDFATEITIFNAKDKRMQTENEISNEHVTNNESVRKTLISRGITPEKLPPEEDVKKIERRLKSEDKKSLKNKKKLEE